MTSLSSPAAPTTPAASDSDAALLAIEERLQRLLGGPGLASVAAAHLVSAPRAQRIRPRLLLTFAEMAAPGGVPADRLIAAGSAVELIHSASLLHDDVVDDARLRRGRPSVNARFGNETAVLVGDHVLATALQLLSFEPRAMSAAVDAVALMSVAAVRELELRGDIDVPRAQLLSIAEGKTGALFGLCGTLAGVLAADDDAGARCAHAAAALGLAFQIADDVADIDNDLLERTPTSVIALACADASIAAAVQALWSRAAVDADAAGLINARIGASEAIAGARQQIGALVDDALGSLAPWQGTKGHAEVSAFAERLSTAAVPRPRPQRQT